MPEKFPDNRHKSIFRQTFQSSNGMIRKGFFFKVYNNNALHDTVRRVLMEGTYAYRIS